MSSSSTLLGGWTRRRGFWKKEQKNMFCGKGFLKRTYMSKVLNIVYHRLILVSFTAFSSLTFFLCSSLQAVRRQRDIKVKEEGSIQFKLLFITFFIQFPFHIYDLFSFRDSQSEEEWLEQIAYWRGCSWLYGFNGGGSEGVSVNEEPLGSGWNLQTNRGAAEKKVLYSELQDWFNKRDWTLSSYRPYFKGDWSMLFLSY